MAEHTDVGTLADLEGANVIFPARRISRRPSEHAQRFIATYGLLQMPIRTGPNPEILIRTGRVPPPQVTRATEGRMQSTINSWMTLQKQYSHGRR